jgi:hypothetical protein
MSIMLHFWAFALLLHHTFLAAGWSSAGHQRIVEVVDVLLKGKKKRHISTLLQGNLLEFADWEQKMTRSHPETDVLHWHHQEPEWNCTSMLGESGHIQCDGHGATAGSLFCGMAYFFEHFAHDVMLQDFPELKEPVNTPKELDVLRKVSGVELTPAHYLRWLISLIGDMHQPLHILRQHNYGREVRVEYAGQVHTLLDFWEEFISQRLPPLPAQAVLERQLNKGLERFFQKTPVDHFRLWAREAATSVCTQVYGKLGVPAGSTPDSPIKVDEEVYQGWLKLANDFTRVAGLRVTEVLLDIVKHENHKAAHKHGQGKYHKNSLRYPWGFTKNLLVAIVLVPILLLALNWHENNGARLKLTSHRKD